MSLMLHVECDVNLVTPFTDQVFDCVRRMAHGLERHQVVLVNIYMYRM